MLLIAYEMRSSSLRFGVRVAYVTATVVRLWVGERCADRGRLEGVGDGASIADRFLVRVRERLLMVMMVMVVRICSRLLLLLEADRDVLVLRLWMLLHHVMVVVMVRRACSCSVACDAGHHDHVAALGRLVNTTILLMLGLGRCCNVHLLRVLHC